MRCIILLSGGKDSVAAVEVAQMHGWDVVAALRMVPVEDDAWMFHTPNLNVVEGIAEALGIPLVTAAARADPVLEVEDLEAALVAAKKEFNLDAVLSGALASEYQRTRIDAIGHRIGLHTFAPLWHKDPDTYMDSLLKAGYHIRFSRVAADGLDASWAGARLDQEKLEQLRGMRMHVAGEGGEYETLVLDAPHYLHALEITEAEVVATASRATWNVQAVHSLPKRPSP